VPVPRMASGGWRHWRAMVWAEFSRSEGAPCQPGGVGRTPVLFPAAIHVHTIDATFDFVLEVPF